MIYNNNKTTSTYKLTKTLLVLFIIAILSPTAVSVSVGEKMSCTSCVYGILKKAGILSTPPTNAQQPKPKPKAEDQTECSICLSEMQHDFDFNGECRRLNRGEKATEVTTTQLNCGHCFHLLCAAQIRGLDSDSIVKPCPICREGIDEELEIYLQEANPDATPLTIAEVRFQHMLFSKTNQVYNTIDELLIDTYAVGGIRREINRYRPRITDLLDKMRTISFETLTLVKNKMSSNEEESEIMKTIDDGII
eukprot:Pgem_evm1s19728